MKIYLVGGAVRDELLGRECSDKDYVVVGSSPEEMKSLGFSEVGNTFPVFLHPETGEEYALARREAKEGEGYKGFSCAFTPDVTIKEDLARRDLTINAIAKDVDTGEYIDIFDGIQDIKDKMLRATTQSFVEDPLRALRLARFSAQLNFSVEEDTLNLAADIWQKEGHTLPKERVQREFEKALESDYPHNFMSVVHRLEDSGPVWFGPLINNLTINERISIIGSFKDLAGKLYGEELFAAVSIKHFLHLSGALNESLPLPNKYLDMEKDVLSLSGGVGLTHLMMQHNFNWKQNFNQGLERFYKRPERFYQCCKLIEYANLPKWYYFWLTIFKLCFHNVVKMGTKDISKKAIEEGLQGKEIGDRIEEERTKIINNILELIDE